MLVLLLCGFPETWVTLVHKRCLCETGEIFTSRPMSTHLDPEMDTQLRKWMSDNFGSSVMECIIIMYILLIPVGKLLCI